MKDKVMKQVEELNKQTIGVEIEMAGITRRAAIKAVSEYFGTAQKVIHKGHETMLNVTPSVPHFMQRYGPIQTKKHDT